MRVDGEGWLKRGVRRVDLEKANPRAPGVDGLEPVRNRHERDAGPTQALFLGCENIRLPDLQREPGQAGGRLVARAGAGALPDVEPRWW